MLVTVDTQHAHSMGTNTNEAHRKCEFVVFCMGETFCKNVGYLISCWDIFKFDILTSNTFPNKVMANLNVFGPCMRSRINSKHQNTLIVTKDSGGNSRRE